jgi:hypothetical protein
MKTRTITDLIEACKAALSYIDDDAEPYPPPRGYTEHQLKEKLSAAIRQAESGVCWQAGWKVALFSVFRYAWWRRCEHACGWTFPYGFVPEAGCPVHDAHDAS